MAYISLQGFCALWFFSRLALLLFLLLLLLLLLNNTVPSRRLNYLEFLADFRVEPTNEVAELVSEDVLEGILRVLYFVYRPLVTQVKCANGLYRVVNMS